MTELKKFLFDFDFDDIQLMEAIDQAESEEDLAPEEDVGIEPEPEPPLFSENDVEIARQEGFSAGKEAGNQEALTGIENIICHALDKIAIDISQVKDNQNEFNERTEHDATELALSVCRKIFPTLSEEGKLTEVSEMARSMISQILSEPKFTIYTHADVVDPLREKLEPFLSEKGFKGTVSVVDDKSISLSGCRVEWQDGQAVRDPEVTLQEIEQTVSTALKDQPPTPEIALAIKSQPEVEPEIGINMESGTESGKENDIQENEDVTCDNTPPLDQPIEHAPGLENNHTETAQNQESTGGVSDEKHTESDSGN